MEDVLKYQLLETSRSRAEYDNLYERFKWTNKVLEARENDSRNKIEALEDENLRLRTKCNSLQRSVKEYQKEKKYYETDVDQLSYAAKLLEAHETNLRQKFDSLNISNKVIQANLESTSRELEDQKTECRNLREAVMKDYIPMRLFEEAEGRYHDIEFKISSECVEKSKYLKLEGELDELRRNVTTSYVKLDDHRAVLSKCERLEHDMKEMVPKEEYSVLRQQLEGVIDESRTIEQSILILETASSTHESVAVETEARCASLRSRIDQSELELEQLRARTHSLTSANEGLRSGLSSIESEKLELSKFILSLESDKSSLMTQLGAAKSQMRKWFDHEAKLDVALQEAQAEVQQLKSTIVKMAEENMNIEASCTAKISAIIQQHDIALAEAREEAGRAVEALRTSHEGELEQFRGSFEGELAVVRTKHREVCDMMRLLKQKADETIEQKRLSDANHTKANIHYDSLLQQKADEIAEIIRTKGADYAKVSVHYESLLRQKADETAELVRIKDADCAKASVHYESLLRQKADETAELVRIKDADCAKVSVQYESQLKVLFDSHTALKEKISGLKATAARERNRADGLLADKFELETQLAEAFRWQGHAEALAEQAAGASKLAETANREKDALRADRAAIRSEMNALRADKEALRLEKGELQDLANRLGKRVVRLEAEINAFKAAVLGSYIPTSDLAQDDGQPQLPSDLSFILAASIPKKTKSKSIQNRRKTNSNSHSKSL
jgi:hypothetical protein